MIRTSRATFGVLVLSASGCLGPIEPATDLPTYDALDAAGCVEITGWKGDAMEPFATPDGRYLVFNNRNSPPERTDLHWARRVASDRFEYIGPVSGANSPSLDAVASVDNAGRFFFVSTRSYDESLQTLFEGTWREGVVSGVHPVAGIARGVRGWLNFDAEVSRDGDTLYFVDGRFTGASVPAEADLAIARRRGNAFERDPRSTAWLENVNTAALEYAPAISANELELFFTRLDLETKRIAIYRAERATADVPFGAAARVAAATGFVEAATFADDGHTIYFHRLDGDHYRICRATR